MNIYIYLSEQTKEKLKEIQKKYHVSISTIGQILTDLIKPMINTYNVKFFTEYLDKEHREKTTIKPNNTKENSEFFEKIDNDTAKASHIYSNILFWYANEKFDLIFGTIDKNKIKKYAKEIEKELINKREIFWNYNNNIRNQVRIVKKNADYFKKILGA